MPSAEGAARLRAVHLDMVAAVVAGEGLVRVEALAAAAVGAPVAIVLPRLDEARPVPLPSSVEMEIPIETGEEQLGSVVLLGRPTCDDAAEVLHLAAMASLTELAVADARVEVEENLRGSFLEDLRAGRLTDAGEIVRRAGRLGCSLGGGAVALCADPATERPRHLVAMVSDEVPGALAQLADDGRVYGLVPGSEKDARRVADRLRRHGTVGLSSFCAEPAALGRALGEAALVLDVSYRSGLPVADRLEEGTYRLLFRVLASHPEEVEAFFRDTIAPLVAYDEQYGSELVATLEAWLANDGSASATAAAIFVHRHTVGYRLDRVKELTGLDPSVSEDRERLGLGLKAWRVLGPEVRASG